MTPALRTVLFGSPWRPSRLFSAGEQGAWFDPSDLSTLFQDSAGTTPVTAAGQSVGKILDKSGRGNHATQATSANRPVLQQDSSGLYYLAFNGTSSSLATASVDFTVTDKVLVVAGLHKNSDAAQAALVELSANGSTNNGAFFVTAPQGGTNYYGFSSKGTSQQIVQTTNASYAAPVTSVVAGIGSISVPSSVLRVNGAQVVLSSASQGTGTYGNYPIYIGARGGTSLFFNGSLYGLIVRGAATNDTQVSRGERWINSKTLAY